MFYFTCNESKIYERLTFWNNLQEKNELFHDILIYWDAPVYTLENNTVLLWKSHNVLEVWFYAIYSLWYMQQILLLIRSPINQDYFLRKYFQIITLK